MKQDRRSTNPAGALANRALSHVRDGKPRLPVETHAFASGLC